MAGPIAPAPPARWRSEAREIGGFYTFLRSEVDKLKAAEGKMRTHAMKQCDVLLKEYVSFNPYIQRLYFEHQKSKKHGDSRYPQAYRYSVFRPRFASVWDSSPPAVARRMTKFIVPESESTSGYESSEPTSTQIMSKTPKPERGRIVFAEGTQQRSDSRNPEREASRNRPPELIRYMSPDTNPERPRQGSPYRISEGSPYKYRKYTSKPQNGAPGEAISEFTRFLTRPVENTGDPGDIPDSSRDIMPSTSRYVSQGETPSGRHASNLTRTFRVFEPLPGGTHTSNLDAAGDRRCTVDAKNKPQQAKAYETVSETTSPQNASYGRSIQPVSTRRRQDELAQPQSENIPGGNRHTTGISTVYDAEGGRYMDMPSESESTLVRTSDAGALEWVELRTGTGSSETKEHRTGTGSWVERKTGTGTGSSEKAERKARTRLEHRTGTSDWIELRTGTAVEHRTEAERAEPRMGAGVDNGTGAGSSQRVELKTGGARSRDSSEENRTYSLGGSREQDRDNYQSRGVLYQDEGTQTYRTSTSSYGAPHRSDPDESFEPTGIGEPSVQHSTQGGRSIQYSRQQGSIQQRTYANIQQRGGNRAAATGVYTYKVPAGGTYRMPDFSAKLPEAKQEEGNVYVISDANQHRPTSEHRSLAHVEVGHLCGSQIRTPEPERSRARTPQGDKCRQKRRKKFAPHRCDVRELVPEQRPMKRKSAQNKVPETRKYTFYKYYGFAGQGAKTSWAHNCPLGLSPPHAQKAPPQLEPQIL